MSMRNIHVLFTGGTIEKMYDEVRGGIDNIEDRIHAFFPRLRFPYVQIHPCRLMNIDSLHMTDDHRRVIMEKVAKTQESGHPIVITHGTDTMADTGRYIKRNLKDVRVPVVLTGAMLPLVVENSDGLQNLTESFFATQLLLPGVYIVFHNEVYDVDKVRKNREKKTFERLAE